MCILFLNGRQYRNICRYKMIVRLVCILSILCIFVQCDQDETPKTHVGKFDEMINEI